ncbi:MAG: hypothetical protein P8R43_07820, partial [Planctomycetota bacterium]|nr:hypothetical protein [Planctomycetota bacterium]
YGYGYGADEAPAAGSVGMTQTWDEPVLALATAPPASKVASSERAGGPIGGGPQAGADGDELPSRVDVAPSTRRQRGSEAER